MTAPDEPAHGDDRSEFDRFEDLTRRLVRVPKDELDRKRGEEKARKG